jgi:3-dehydroquinate dehydratase-2
MAKSKKKVKILVINGPNLNTLGTREPGIYGDTTLADINTGMKKLGEKLGMTVQSFQSNHEGEIVEKIQKSAGKFDGLIINPAAYTHTSIAVRDAILLLDIPVIEIHLSNIYKREPFRHKSLISDVVTGRISGFGVYGYTMAIHAMGELIRP